jgi:hypothetical protein
MRAFLSSWLSVSWFNRRLHQLADWLPGLLNILSQSFQAEGVFVMDSLPVPVCKQARACEGSQGARTRILRLLHR